MISKALSINEALDLGVQYAMGERHADAIGLFRGVLIHEPENFEAIERLGSSLFSLGQYHEALYWFWRGRKINRRHPLALTNYGLCISQLGHWEEGLADLELARFHAEKQGASSFVMALIWNNLGNTLQKLNRYEDALTALDKGLSFNPDEQFAIYNKGIAFLRLNRHRDGIAALDQALSLRPDDVDARYNRSLARLLLGDLRGGFADYEARLVTSENGNPNFGLPVSHKWKLVKQPYVDSEPFRFVPRLLGEPIAGKRLLVHGEQGLGDSIQFLRFLPRLVEMGAQVELVIHGAIAECAKSIAGVTVLPERALLTARHKTLKTGVDALSIDVVDGYDHWVALASLPLMLGIEREEDIPPPWKFPIETDRRVVHLGLGLPQSSGRPAIGVCWAGNFLHKNDHHRSIPLKTFARLFDTDCDFYSIQQMRAGEREEMLALKQSRPHLHAVEFEDLRDTAAVIANLDLVITCDTSVAHLAGTLGKPTWILLPAFGTDWRWQLGREDSPWYPAARLFRQPKIGDWASVIGKVRNELQTLSMRRAA